MKITIYELLGLIKNEKAPKKIIYNNRVWEYETNIKDYYNEMWSLLENQFDVITKYFEDEVEIIEEENKAEINDLTELREYIDKQFDRIFNILNQNANLRKIFLF